MRIAAVRLSMLALSVMGIAAVAGLVLPNAYGEPDSTAAMLRAYDLVTLALGVPLLGWALRALRRGSLLAELVWVAVLGYALYLYALYLFGTGFTDLFLLHVVVFAATVFALPLALATLDRGAIAARLGGRGRPRLAAGALGVLAAGMGVMWVVVSLQYAISHRLPEGSVLVETDTVAHVGVVLDLTLLVPWYAAAAVLLWRRAPWGYVAASAALISGTLIQIGYLLAMPFQVAADVPGAQAFDPVEPVIVLLYLLAAVALLDGFRARLRAPARA